jgi:hypothetical protein
MRVTCPDHPIHPDLSSSGSGSGSGSGGDDDDDDDDDDDKLLNTGSYKTDHKGSLIFLILFR